MPQDFTILKPQYNSEYEANNAVVISTFYKFQQLENLEEVKSILLKNCNMLGIKGTIILAHEGINGTISGDRISLNMFYKFITERCKIHSVEFKESLYKKHPFQKLKVNIKKEVVSMYEETCPYAPGTYIAPKDWDNFISSPDVITIDTRNNYEYYIGTFQNALNPNTENFSHFKEWCNKNLKDKSQKIASFCTGGIRCEKSTSWLHQQGNKNLYHLKGGIIGYFIETQNKNQTWIGDCFVFDDRIIINHHLEAR